MAPPGSGSMSLSMIQGEFGGSNPISISEYYRNGGLVPSNNTGVPTSGAISLGNFYGAVNESVSISVTSASASRASPADASATYSLRSDGTITRVINGSSSTAGTWVTPTNSTAASHYQVLATLNSGTTPGGSSLGTWLNLTSDVSWFLSNTNNSNSTVSCSLAVSIRNASSGTVVASATVTISANVTV